ncbi:cobalamin-dependent protein [Desulfonatronospira sp.]|uniref:cobalamin B12-binding domain-containing protein n=1 Tax=Desulfonatronospira sp. TaxID=1962951 RepID=UPI0025C1915F|nr:cobalamin-dependent protein [Desulfonatronospira sp.]
MINSELYNNYLQALLQGNRMECTKIVKDLLDRDVTIYDLYLDLFQTSLYEVGYLWETNRISVATEHMATSITESLLSLAYPKIFSAQHVGKKAVVSCLVNEYHQIGGKMVADIFEINGWDGYFLGANTPVQDLLGIVRNKQPEIVALSMSLFFNIDYLHNILQQLESELPGQQVIVGGQAFRWGGTDIQDQYSNVKYISSIKELEKMLHEYE